MRNYKGELEVIANGLLTQQAGFVGGSIRPNYTNRDLMNTIIIFQAALMDKMFDYQDSDEMDMEDRYKMARSCGSELRRLVHTYTGLDTHKVEEFL